MNADTSKVREFLSHYGFTETIDRLVEAIQSAGLHMFATIDHAAAAAQAGLQMPRTTVLFYGNPVAGTPLMRAAPRAALDLPLRVLVREDEDGFVCVAYHPVAAALEAAGVPPDDATRLASAQKMLIGAVKRLTRGEDASRTG